MRRAARATVLAVGALLLMLIAYEAFAVARARARTPATLARAHPDARLLAELPPRRLAMLLRVEDPGFFHHHGVDFATPGQGATTITQALVKRLYFQHFRPGFAKIEQSLIARLVLDPAMSKRDQLALFIGSAGFGTVNGREVTGFPDAARTYYGTDLRALTDRQFISLVAMGIAPNALDPIRHPAENAERVRRIEALLAGRCKPRGLGDVTYPDCARAGVKA